MKIRKTFLPYCAPQIGEEEIRAVSAVLASGWVGTGPHVRQFEQEFAASIGASAALGFNSCTAAMHAALLAMEIGPGDEVILPTMTFASTANVVHHVGARPLLVDIKEDTLNIDPNAVEIAISPRTRCIMPVHYAGLPADMKAIRAFADEFGLHVLEDAAHALGAAIEGKSIGSGLNQAAFSFYPTKNITTGEGGMLTGEPELLEKAQVFGLHGMSLTGHERYEKGGSWDYSIEQPGFKYNMTDIAAGIGLAQLKKLEEFQNRRREIAMRYNEAFASESSLQTPFEPPSVTHAWHLYVLRLNLDAIGIDRNGFIEEMRERNVGTSVHFRPIHMHTFYSNEYGYTDADMPVAAEQFERIVSLPLYPAMSDEDVDYVIDCVLDVVRTHKRAARP